MAITCQAFHIFGINEKLTTNNCHLITEDSTLVLKFLENNPETLHITVQNKELLSDW